VTITADGRRKLSDAVMRLRSKEEFSWNLENGLKTYRSATSPSGKHARMPNESFLARIPRKDSSQSN